MNFLGLAADLATKYLLMLICLPRFRKATNVSFTLCKGVATLAEMQSDVGFYVANQILILSEKWSDGTSGCGGVIHIVTYRDGP